MANQDTPRCPPDASAISYTFLRHIGYMLDELSAQGLRLWTDDGRWYWHWVGTPYFAERGFWALGEAIVDAITARFPASFDSDSVEA